MRWHDRYKQTQENMLNTEPQFDGYDKFLEAARERLGN